MKQSLYQRLSNWMEIGTDLVLLNLLWLACCLPIVTIGASTAAMHYVARKMVTGEPYKVAGSFFHSFRENWKQGIGLELLILMLAIIGAGDFYAGTLLAGWMGTACQIVGVLAVVAAFAVLTVGFPLLARYQLPFSGLVKNALILALTNPLAIIAHAVVLAVLPVIVILKGSLIAYAVPIGILFLGGTAALVIEAVLRPVFARLEKTTDAEENKAPEPEA